MLFHPPLSSTVPCAIELIVRRATPPRIWNIGAWRKGLVSRGRMRDRHDHLPLRQLRESAAQAILKTAQSEPLSEESSSFRLKIKNKAMSSHPKPLKTLTAIWEWQSLDPARCPNKILPALNPTNLNGCGQIRGQRSLQHRGFDGVAATYPKTHPMQAARH